MVRTLGEFFRLRHVHGTSFSAAVSAPYIGGALIAFSATDHFQSDVVDAITVPKHEACFYLIN